MLAPRHALLVLLTLLGGCTSTGDSMSDRWANSFGGRMFDERLVRVTSLASALLINEREQPRIRVSVLNHGGLVAYSYPGGEIFVSRALVDALNDVMLSAALAHEIAHVLNHQQRVLAGLHGADSAFQTEVRADAVGVALLLRSGMPAHSMADMLGVVVQGDVPPKVRADLLRRIAVVQRSEVPQR